MFPNVLVLTNDAGATEYLAYLISEYKRINWKVFVFSKSPAIKILERLNIEYYMINYMEELCTLTHSFKIDIIIYGTGWNKNFSKIVKSICNKTNSKSIGLIDHWTKYKERFYINNLPDYIMVMDDYAYKLAKKIFSPEVSVIQVKNYFLENTYKSYFSIEEKKASSVVFISEPTSMISSKYFKKKDGYGFTEYSVLLELLDVYDSLIIRLHPSDDDNKYDKIIDTFTNKKISLIRAEDEDLVTTLSKSNLTIGFDGMALYISYVLGIKTVSYMPNSARTLSIPIPKEYLIRDLENLKFIEFNTKKSNFLQKNSLDFNVVLKKILGGN